MARVVRSSQRLEGIQESPVMSCTPSSRDLMGQRRTVIKVLITSATSAADDSHTHNVRKIFNTLFSVSHIGYPWGAYNAPSLPLGRLFSTPIVPNQMPGCRTLSILSCVNSSFLGKREGKQAFSLHQNSPVG